MVKVHRYTEIALEEIKLGEDTFSFSFPEEAGGLAESIRKTGLLYPVILYHNRIVCGRRRALACKRLGWKKIPAGIIKGKLPGIDLFRLGLQDNISTRELNIIEKTRILNKLLNTWQVPVEEVIKEYLPLLGIPPNIRYLKRYTWLFELGDGLKQTVLDKKVSPDTLNIARDWPAKTRERLLGTVLSFGLGSNKTGDILRLLNDISLKDNSPAGAPLKEGEWTKIKNNPQMAPYQKGLWLRNFLLTKRYPEHTEFKNRVKALVSKLNLPENICMQLNDLLTWEEDSINFKVKCRKKKDLETAIKCLRGLSRSRELCELLEILRLSR